MMSRNQRGDTIVEVMIALAIVSLVIAVSFATANRSLRVGRIAQERTQALKEAESQIEILKSFANGTTHNIFADTLGTGSFCVTPTGITTQAAISPNVDSASLDVVPNGSQTYNSTCTAGQGSLYKISIERTGTNPRFTFTVRVRWERLGGGRDEVVLVYSLHPTNI